MKFLLAFSLLSTALALPEFGKRQTSSNSDTSKYDGFNFRIGYETTGSDKRYVSWVAGLDPCHNRVTIGKGTTSWCGRETSVPYTDEESIGITFECDQSDNQYNEVTYTLDSGQEGRCSHLRETFDTCGTDSLTTILKCGPSKRE
ncbi:hypothetical protein SLS56_002949 [Neofusicoccum ribis]|uniref:AA1-like domain-containing protein n=1 Tax=Neofusicoccum ribis TaxID=45134 RepID=A0ABR3T2H0_9PEZI